MTKPRLLSDEIVSQVVAPITTGFCGVMYLTTAEVTPAAMWAVGAITAVAFAFGVWRLVCVMRKRRISGGTIGVALFALGLAMLFGTILPPGTAFAVSLSIQLLSLDLILSSWVGRRGGPPAAT